MTEDGKKDDKAEDAEVTHRTHVVWVVMVCCRRNLRKNQGMRVRIDAARENNGKAGEEVGGKVVRCCLAFVDKT